MGLARQRWQDVALVVATFSTMAWGIAAYSAYFFEPYIFAVLTRSQEAFVFALPFAWFLVFAFLATVSMTSYLRAVFTDPGAVPFEFSYEALATADEESVSHGGATRESQYLLLTPSRPELRRAAESTANACDKCQLFKPPRTHHCSRCARCVLKYDHHCPWMGNCVGYYNYKFYLQFIVSTWLLVWVTNLTLLVPAAQSAAWLLGSDVPPLPGCGAKVHYAEFVAIERSKLPPRDFLSAHIAPMPRNMNAGICGLWMLPLFVLAALAQLWLGYLVNRHRWLLCNNMTTVEHVQFGQPRNWRFSLSTTMANVRAVFGARARWYEFVLPTTPELHVEDAVSFFAPLEARDVAPGV